MAVPTRPIPTAFRPQPYVVALVAFVVTTASVVFACARSEDERSDSPTLGGDAALGDGANCPSGQCLPFHLDCNGDAADGCETNVRSDVLNCGGCGVTCLDAGLPPPFTRPSCLDGTCRFTCITDDSVGPLRNCASPDPLIGDPVQGCSTAILCDPSNCGGCGVVAPLDSTGDRICASGAPLAACPDGKTNCHAGSCGTQCVDTNTDSANCGVCGRTCPDPTIPAATISVLRDKHIVFACGGTNPDGGLAPCLPACATTGPPEPHIWKDCDGDVERTVADPTNPAYNGCELDTYNVKDHCGACDVACQVACHTKPGTKKLEQICDCPVGASWCVASSGVGACVNLDNDPFHCGACGNACPGPRDGQNGGATCTVGQCGFKCKAGYADCNHRLSDGCEIDTQNSPSDCGSCGHACLPDQRCGNGQCLVEQCAPPLTK